MPNKRIHLAAARGDIAEVERLLQRGSRVDARDEQDRTPLMFSASDARAGTDMLDLLLAKGADPNAVAAHIRDTPLRKASHSVIPDHVHRLLEAGARATWVDPLGYGPLLDAAYGCMCGKRDQGLQVMRLLLDAGAANGNVTIYGESPLRVASDSGLFEAVRLLIDSDADTAQLQWSPLHQAVALGDAEDVSELLRHGADLYARDYWERTPWLLSLAVGDVMKAEALLHAGACRDDRGRCQRTNIMYPPLRDSADCLSWLLAEGADLRAVDEFRKTPLMAAAAADAIGCARVLLAAGAEIHAADHVGSTALDEVSSPAILRLLVEAGADLNRVDGTGYSVLKNAAENGDIAMVRAGLEMGASPNVTSTGDTPLHAAVAADQLEIVRLLLDAGADLEARDVDGQTALMYAWTPECANLLLDAGANVYATDDAGDMPLFHAVDRGWVETLVDIGVDTGTANADGKTALMCAAEVGEVESLRTLLDAGAPIEARDRQGRTALFYAAAPEAYPAHKGKEWLRNVDLHALVQSHVAIELPELPDGVENSMASQFGKDYSYGDSVEPIEVLLSAGAKVDASDHQRLTALHLASSCGNPARARCLLEHGANPNARTWMLQTPARMARRHTDERSRDRILRLLNRRSGN